MYVWIIYVCTSVVIRSLAKCVPCVRRALRHDVCPCSQENENDDDGLLIYSRKNGFFLFIRGRMRSYLKNFGIYFASMYLLSFVVGDD